MKHIHQAPAVFALMLLVLLCGCKGEPGGEPPQSVSVKKAHLEPGVNHGEVELQACYIRGTFTRVGLDLYVITDTAVQPRRRYLLVSNGNRFLQLREPTSRVISGPE